MFQTNKINPLEQPNIIQVNKSPRKYLLREFFYTEKLKYIGRKIVDYIFHLSSFQSNHPARDYLLVNIGN